MKYQKVYKTGEVAKILDLPRQTVLRYCVEGKLPATQHPISKVWKVQNEDLVTYMEKFNLDTSSLVRPMRVIVVDDDPGIRMLISQVLVKFNANIELYLFPNGYEALLEFATINPDLLILDVQMPKMDGREFLKIVKEKGGRTTRFKVIAITGYPDYQEEMLELGADLVLIKPFMPMIMLENIDDLMKDYIY